MNPSPRPGCHVTLHPVTRGPWSRCGLPVVKFGRP
jgi:hypothetical protein